LWLISGEEVDFLTILREVLPKAHDHRGFVSSLFHRFVCFTGFMHTDTTAVLTFTGLTEALAEEVAARVANTLKEHGGLGPDPDGLLDYTQAADLLAMSPQAVQSAASRGQLPCLRTPLGQRRFVRRELLAWAYGEAA
jgi:Helix-turn-helix domain